METRIDCYGRTITKTVEGDEEVYVTSGVTLRCPLGRGWEQALYVIEAHAPAGWVPPTAD